MRTTHPTPAGPIPPKRIRSAWERATINRAKRLLMDGNSLTEEAAYNLLRCASMQYQKPLPELAKAVILSFGRSVSVRFDQETTPRPTADGPRPFFR